MATTTTTTTAATITADGSYSPKTTYINTVSAKFKRETYQTSFRVIYQDGGVEYFAVIAPLGGVKTAWKAVVNELTGRVQFANSIVNVLQIERKS